jgi:tRNA threonylcarbamoyladenosine biosynthesis protein TsaB
LLGGESPAPHSRTLFGQIATLLELVGIGPEEIDAFGVATGPGSFTGLRVGLAAIRGLAHTLGRPAFGITSLDALALSAGVTGLVAPMIKAGRGEVYYGVREVKVDGEIEVVGRDQVGQLEAALAQMIPLLRDAPAVLVGDGVDTAQSQILQLARSAGIQAQLSAVIARERAGWQLKRESPFLAPDLARQAGRMLAAGQGAAAHAYYLRASDAELKWRDSSQIIPA